MSGMNRTVSVDSAHCGPKPFTISVDKWTLDDLRPGILMLTRTKKVCVA